MTSQIAVTRRVVERALRQPEGFLKYQLRMAIQDAVAAFGAEGARMLADDMVSDTQDRMRKIS